MTDLRDQLAYHNTVTVTADDARAAGNATVLDNHRVVRDGSVWTCGHCKRTWPFPGRLPDDAGPCVPRRWGDQA